MSFNYKQYILYNQSVREQNIFTKEAAEKHYNTLTEEQKQKYPINFQENNYLKCKDYVVTLMGYTEKFPKCHTNWFPWNRFRDVFKTIGYKCEWTNLQKLRRNGEKRVFITWNDPTSIELYRSCKVRKDDIILQKLTSLGKGMNNVNWTANSEKWNKKWKWPIYRCFDSSWCTWL